MSTIESYKKDIKKYKELIQQYESENDSWKRSQDIKIEVDGMRINLKGTNGGIISTGTLNNTTIYNNGLNNPPHDPAKFDYLYNMIDDRRAKIKQLEESSE